jgi:hypothetical protein
MDEYMKKYNHVLFLVSFLSSFFLVHTLWAFETEFAGNWYLNVGAGRTQPLTDSNNFVGTGTGWPDDYYTANDTHGSFMATIGAGYIWNRYNDWFPALSLGAQFTYTTQSKISGMIQQYSLPEFENYTYDYQFRRRTLLGIGKADIYRIGNFLPYVTGGLGVSFNTTSNYSEQPLSNVTPRISPSYRSVTHDYISYMAGLGVDFVICNYLWLSVEYNYGNFGFAKTGNGVSTPSMTGFDYSNQNLKNKLTANNFLFSATYLLNYV